MSKRVIILLAVLTLCAVISTVFLHQSYKQKKEQSGLIMTLLMPALTQASDDFYSEYLSDNPSVSNYSGKMISLKKDEHGDYVTISIQPYIGPHDPVGDDEVEFFVDNIGHVSLLRFSHKKNYELPARLGVTIKKPIPISSAP